MSLIKKIMAAILLQGLLAFGCSDAQTDNITVTQADTTHYDHTNNLIGENSPYLLSHAHNPVDWYPWGKEALAAAKREDKPIFLSIGYAACHWCHVMERESFENEEIAALMNQYFISIKVDREQRPDLDHIYMSFTQAMTGGGGWPMSVFLTPDLMPFYAGTYFPPEDRYGRPGFRKIITELGKAYQTQKVQITESSEKLFSQMSGRLSASLAPTALRKDMISRGAQGLMRNFDHSVGGFGSRPKFPHPMELSLFLRYSQASGDAAYLNAAKQALSAMARGGIYDHLGGGFARYSTDANWQIPHFEKMLYDNALLVPVYVEAYRVTGNPLYKKVVTETLDFILRELTDVTGGFYSSLDADSEGEEGKFYVWSKTEIDSILGDESKFFSDYYSVTARGNFEQHNILHLTPASDILKKQSGKDFEARLKRSSDKLLTERAKRVRPPTDDKILTAWNGLALTAFCYGYQITGERRFLEAAVKNARFVRDKLYANGHLVHAYREGRKSEGRFLEDNAYYVQGLLDLYETDLKDNSEWLEFARTLADQALDDFMDASGTLYLREDGLADLIVRPKDENDSAIPAPGSVLLVSLFKLNRITGNSMYAEKGELGLKAISGQLARIPQNLTTALFALDYMLEDKIEVVIVGDSPVRDEMISELYGRFLPRMVLAFSDDGSEATPLFEGRGRNNKNETLAYVCINSACKLPVSSVDNLRNLLDNL